MRQRILLVDDEPGIRASLKVVLEPAYEVLAASSGVEGLTLLHQESPDLVLLDIIMPGEDGMVLLQRMRQEAPDVPVIMLTATKTVKTAVGAMKMGAADYVTKPFDVEELRLIVSRTLAARALEQEVQYLRAQVVNRYSFHNLIGKSPSMQEVYAKIEQLADTRTTVLVTGESGTGKELVARALHYNSARRDRPFIAINCAALPDTLIESELFGHEKGSFTDARMRRVGHFELAHGGSLFLDEISEISPAIQAKLLRVLQEREVTRVGGTQPVKVDVRIIAATNKDLADLLRRGQFREDMYYRINVVSINLPALRDRREDIPLLARHFLTKRLEEEHRPPQEYSQDVIEVLTKYHWPGNVRELQNVVEQASIWCRGNTITPDNLPSAIRTETLTPALRTGALSGHLTLEKAVMEFERQLILDALKQTDFVQVHAAALLGISRRMLKYRMDLLGITREDIRPTSDYSNTAG